MNARLDTLGNVVSIVAAIVFCAWAGPQLRQQWTKPAVPPQREARSIYKAGEAAPSFDTVSYDFAPKTVVLFVRSSCKYCTESMEFYRALADHGGRTAGNYQLVVASPESPGVTAAYLNDHNVRVDKVVSVKDFSNIKISATPTLLVVDRRGILVDVKVGKQPPAGEREVEHQLQSTG